MAEKSWMERHPYLTGGAAVAGLAGLGTLAHKLGPGMLAARKAAKAARKASKAAKDSGSSVAKAVEKTTGKAPKKRVAWGEKPEVGEGAAATTRKEMGEHMSGLFEGGKKAKSVKKPPTPEAAEAAGASKKTVARLERFHKSSMVMFDSFANELSRIHAEKLAVAIIKNPADKLDKRTSRHHRKPNPRMLPPPMPSGKLVV
jgi:hypothetical protein